jgi:hypothetical protein
MSNIEALQFWADWAPRLRLLQSKEEVAQGAR